MTKPERAAYMRAYRARKRGEAKKLAAPPKPGTDTRDFRTWAEAELIVPTGPLSGQPFRIPPWQDDFIRSALARGCREAALSCARKNGKSGLVGALCLYFLVGPGARPQWRGAAVSVNGNLGRELLSAVELTAKASGLKGIEFFRTPYPGRCVAADRRLDFLSADRSSGHGISCDVAIVDEIGLMGEPQRPMLAAMASSLSARDGRLIAISIRGDSPMFSELEQRKDDPAVVWREYAAPPDCALDDPAAWAMANPGIASGIKSSAYMADAARKALAISSEIPSFRAFDLNQPYSPTREPLCDPNDWTRCEVESPPEPQGGCTVGIDLGGSRSMTACSIFWPACGRMESYGAFSSVPDLLERGRLDGVGPAYCTMAERGELRTLGGRVTDVAAFIADLASRLRGQRVLAVGCDRYRQSEMLEACDAAGVRWPLTFRGTGASKAADGSHDVRSYQSWVLSGRIKHKPSLLVASALAASAIRRDGAGNPALDKAHGRGRIDILSSGTIAVGLGESLGKQTQRRRWTKV